jgi:thioredoxin
MNIKLFSFVIALLIITLSCNSQNAASELSAKEFDQQIKSTQNAFILDVRTPDEFAEGYIENAVNINVNSAQFKDEIAKLDKNKTYFVYCLSGKRSASAASYMRASGFKNVINLEGGILAWQSKNLPLATASTAPIADKISMDEYNKMINSGTKVLIDYYAPWCAPCIKMKPMLEELEKEYDGKVKVIRLDINENKQLAKQLNIVEIPVIKIFENGKEIWNHNGFITKEDLKKQL